MVTWGNVPGGPHNLVVQEIDGTTGCSSFDTLEVTVFPKPVLDPIPSVPAVCPGDVVGPISFNSTPNDTTTNFRWFVSGDPIGLSNGVDNIFPGELPPFTAVNNSGSISTAVVRVVVRAEWMCE